MGIGKRYAFYDVNRYVKIELFGTSNGFVSMRAFNYTNSGAYGSTYGGSEHLIGCYPTESSGMRGISYYRLGYNNNDFYYKNTNSNGCTFIFDFKGSSNNLLLDFVVRYPNFYITVTSDSSMSTDGFTKLEPST